MALNVLVVPDKFKGTLTARAAAEAIARGWHRARPDDILHLLPMSDGGDGFGEVLRRLLRAKSQTVQTVDAAHRPCQARWWWEPKSRTAIIESARVIGLAMLPPKQFHPVELDTFGLGAVIRAAAAKEASRCLIGLGGSATNDGGFGLARALGWKFLDREGGLILSWTELRRLERIRAPEPQRWFRELLVAVDVQNPLLGARGATRVYGPQKGLRPQDLKLAGSCLRRLARVFEKQAGKRLARRPGAGAAGGLGFGLMAFLGARPAPGFDLFAQQAALDRRLLSADLVLTGEGCLDASTLMGKGTGQIARRCRRLKIPCMGLAGAIAGPANLGKDFDQARALTELTTLRQALSKPTYWLERLAESCARNVAASFILRGVEKAARGHASGSLRLQAT